MPARLLLERLVVAEARFRDGDEFHGSRIDRAGDEQNAPAMGGEFQHRTEKVALEEAKRLFGIGLRQVFRRRRGDALDLLGLDPLHHRSVRLHNHRERKTEEDRAGIDEVAEDRPSASYSTLARLMSAAMSCVSRASEVHCRSR